MSLLISFVSPTAKNAESVLLEIVALDDKNIQDEASGETRMNGYLQEVNIEQVAKFGQPFTNEFFNFTLNMRNGETDQTYLLRFNNLHALTSQYMNKTKIGLEEINSDLISIQITGENPHKEADFINELNNVFIQFGMENKFQNSEKSMEFIDSQLARIEQSLGTSGGKIQ